jgi:hypothetical protein
MGVPVGGLLKGTTVTAKLVAACAPWLSVTWAVMFGR